MALLFFISVSKKIQTYLTENNITPRKDAGPGVWLTFLLPLSIILGELTNKNTSHTYKTVACICCGLFAHTVIFLAQVNKNIFFSATTLVIPCSLSALLLFYLTNEGVLLSILYGISTISAYHASVFPMMKLFPRNFTYGEATVAAQGLVLFLLSSFIRNPLGSASCLDTSTVIVQFGILWVMGIGAAAYHFNWKRKPKQFYSSLLLTMIFILLLPLYFLIGESPLTWILSLVIQDNVLQILFFYWSICCLLGVLTIYLQIRKGNKASTVVRKTFHILTVMVFAPGIILRPCFLFLSSGVVFGIFIAIDMLRILQIPPLGSILQTGYIKFADEKDEGPLALTPLYLLLGCSLPLWIHPDPERSELLPLISGLLSVGIGDTAASACGSLVGKNKWPGSKKTKEGSAACFLSQLFLVIALIHFGYIPRTNLIKPTFAIALVSIVEAKTDQIDNLAMPLLMYVMTIWKWK